ncbi:uncharacterized protein LOC127705790 [Mytilus californianus]|uniref:uncharacterized protein LOC127705790 n=1 Tax=Mytilus californianus TaxID=6549 RepID=UPI0022486FCD|nr:uncharacterized protein LOC127705790 [Mytilus californianus]
MAEGKRATGYKISGSDVPISDDRLEPGWYKIVNEGGTEIPTEAPGLMSCGTLFPIWLNGDLPTANTTELSQSVCVQTISSECQPSWTIDIKHCHGNFIIYNLVESQISSSGYCFGKEVKCPDGQYSENGFTPGCTSDVPKEIFSPVVRAELTEVTIHQTSFGPSLEPVFRCAFDAIFEKSYAYDIYWLINNQSIIVHKRISYSSINDTLLRPKDWINDYKMNMMVRCSLRVRLDVDSVPGPTFGSLDFEAGVKPEFTVYEVAEGDEISVRLTSSVPIGCFGSADIITSLCVETLKIAQPEYQDNPSDKCVNSIRKGSTVFETQDCGVSFSTTNWMLPVNLTVKGYIDNYYNSDNRKSYIRLITESKSATDLSGVWDTVNIPEIQVIVSDKDSEVTGRYCGTWNDPRYVTADGKYFTYHGCGEHVLYRNKRYPYWVHTLSTRCWWRGTCNCGIAIRSHDSLFVVRTCDIISTVFYSLRRHHPYISYAACNNEHMTIQKLNRGYKVTLPIGTEISFTVSGGWIPGIAIKPSTLDIEQTEGLCGFVSKTKDTSDDFIPRSSSFATSSVYDFARSWRVGRYSAYGEEDLFTPFPMFPSNDLQLKEYCLCAAEADQNDDISTFTDIHCNLTQPLVQCETAKNNIANRLYQECHTHRMRRDTSNMENDQRKIVKRNALDSDDVIDETSLTYHETFDPNYIPSDPDWKNGWNEDSARERCEIGISEMAALELCQKYANIDKTLYIGLCIEDIKISGSSDYIPYMIWLMEDACKFEISRNESLFSNSSGNNGVAVMETILDLMCPNRCSNNGVCNKSECVCNNGYIGSDCSMTLADAPKEISVPDEGLCGTKQRNCQKTNIFGEFHASNMYCKLEHFIVTDNGKQLSGTEAIVSAVYSYENLISCDFPNSRKRRSTDNRPEGYDISLSFDQTNYGDTVSIIIYDDDCFNCNSTSVTCTELDSCLGFTTETEYGKHLKK